MTSNALCACFSVAVAAHGGGDWNNATHADNNQFPFPVEKFLSQGTMADSPLRRRRDRGGRTRWCGSCSKSAPPPNLATPEIIHELCSPLERGLKLSMIFLIEFYVEGTGGLVLPQLPSTIPGTVPLSCVS